MQCLLLKPLSKLYIKCKTHVFKYVRDTYGSQEYLRCIYLIKSKKVKRLYLMMVTHDSVHLTVKLINVWPSVRTLPPFLCQCSVLRVFKAQATRMGGKSEQALESLRIELGTSSTEGSALTNCATPAPLITG